MKKLLLLFIILTLTGIGLYYLRTYEVQSKAVEIAHPEGKIDNGLFTRTHYMNYQIVPTESTKPETVYKVAVDNGAIRREDKVIWTPLELDIKLIKPISHKLSQNEFIALGQHPRYTVEVSEIRSERNGAYLTIPIIYLLILGLMAWCGVDLYKKKPVRRKFVRSHVEKEQDNDKAQLELCMSCPSFKLVNGIIKCTREKCNKI